MTSLRLLALLGGMTVRVGAQGLKVVEAEIQHFHGEQFGSFIPMVELGLEDGSQKVLSQIDTGSSDLVLAKTNSNVCQEQKKDCQDIPKGAGSFEPSNGSDTEVLQEPFNATFVSGESFTGKFVKTGIQVGDQNTPGVQFGLYDNASQPEGAPLFPILGTGALGVEATDNKYPNMPEQMLISKMIKTNAYGIYINDFRGSNGSVVFGGVDEAKFDGELEELQWIPFPGDPPERGIVDPVVQFSSINFIPGPSRGGSRPGKQKGGSCNNGRGSKNRGSRQHRSGRRGSDNQKGGFRSGNQKHSQKTVDLSGGEKLPPALIDTGAGDMTLPEFTMKRLAKAVGASLDKDLNDDGLTVDCGLAYSGAMIQVGFDNDKAKIQVPLDMMVQPVDLTGVDDCTLALFVAKGEEANITTLGSVMMQAAYIVFDNDQKRLLMAQAKPNVTESSIKELSPAPNKGEENRDGQKGGASENKEPGKRSNDSVDGSRRRARLQRRGDRSRRSFEALKRRSETRRR